MIARRPCTPPLPLEAFNETFVLQLVPVRRKKKKKRNNDDTIIVKSRIRVFSPGESKVSINTWGLCIARDGPDSCCWCVLKA